METIQITVYQFDELEPEAQNKVLGQFSDINVDHDWWEFLYEEFKAELKQVGLTCERFFFDIDRGSFIAPHKLSVDSKELLVKFSEVRTPGRLTDEFDPEFITAGRNNVVVKVSQYGHTGYTRIDKKLDEICESLTSKVYALFEDFLSRLRNEYDGLTSEEAIKETIKANEFKFTAEGRIF